MCESNYRVVPMRLFATWEADRAAGNCIPRICTMALTRLTVPKPLDADVSCFVIAVKLQGFKRTLRSNDINATTSGGGGAIDLDISFTLQYPHFMKRNNNWLHVLLQRRKRYKNRPIPGGFKTLAVGTIDLTEVLQNGVTRELLLYASDAKDDSVATTIGLNGAAQPSGQPLAKLNFLACQSQPIDQEELSVGETGSTFGKRKRKEKENEPMSGGFHGGLMASGGGGSGGGAGDYSDVDDDSTNDDDDNADSDNQLDTAPSSARSRKGQGTKGRRFNLNHHKNLKQRFVNLLNKFKASEEAYSSGRPVSRRGSETASNLEKLLDELDALGSDSGPDEWEDGLSIRSGPKPGLRPYFNSSTSSKEALHAPPSQSANAYAPIDESLTAIASEESKESEGDTPTDVELQEQQLLPSSTSSPNSRPSVFNSGSGIASKQSSEKKKRTPLHQTSDLSNERVIGSRMTHSGSHTQQLSAPSAAVRSASHPMSAQSYVGQQTATSSEQPSSMGGVLPSPLSYAATVSEQLSRIADVGEVADLLWESLWIVSAHDVHCEALVESWRHMNPRLVVVATYADVRSVLAALLGRIQKFCNSNSLSPPPCSVSAIGGDRLASHCVRAYAELLSQKPHEWQAYIRFALVAPPNSTIARCLSTVDVTAPSGSLFADSLWRDFWDKTELSYQEIAEVSGRLQRYLLGTATTTAPMPISEVMLQIRDRRAGATSGGGGGESPQVFVAFIVDVRLCLSDSVDASALSTSDSAYFSPVIAAGGNAIFQSPPSSGGSSVPVVGGITSTPSQPATMSPRGDAQQQLGDPSSSLLGASPPNSPYAGNFTTKNDERSASGGGEKQDLHVEYWAVNDAVTSGGQSGGGSGVGGAGGSGGGGGVERAGSQHRRGDSSGGGGGINSGGGTSKSTSIKCAFKSLMVSKSLAPFQPLDGPPGLQLQFVKEKKKDKVLQKLGMKSKDRERTDVDGRSNAVMVSRLICNSRHSSTIKVLIDGVEWANVKFFQVSAQWQTHIKHFPLALFNGDA